MEYIKNHGRTLDVDLNGGYINANGYGIYKSYGNINLNGGTITSGNYGIYQSIGGGTVNIVKGTIDGNLYGIYNNGGNINIIASNSETDEEKLILGNTHEIYNNEGTVNIISGTIVTTSNTLIENQSSGTVVIGTEGGSISITEPMIQAENYAIDNISRGTVKFFDGKIRGKMGAIQGLYMQTETGYINKTIYAQDGYYEDTLKPSGQVTTVARVGTQEFTSLQSALNACADGEETIVVLTNSITTNETFAIGADQIVILDLNHLGISSSAEVTIQNNGTLKIIDSSGTTGKISATDGKAIVNTGTLTLGTKDGNVSITCPEIEGRSTAIENTGTFNFYDGIVKGAKALEGTVTDRENGYVIEKTTNNSIEQMKLVR